MKRCVEFNRTFHLAFDQDRDIHATIIEDGKSRRAVEIANFFGGGGNQEIYKAALALKLAIEKHGIET